MHENKIIIEKSSIEHENYNILVFFFSCSRDVEEVKIPNFIEIISLLIISKIFKT